MASSPEQTDLEKAARILAFDSHEPPDECDHGFTPPDDCPNDVCADRAVRWAWFVGRYGRPPYDLREGDVEAVMKGA